MKRLLLFVWGMPLFLHAQTDTLWQEDFSNPTAFSQHWTTTGQPAFAQWTHSENDMPAIPTYPTFTAPTAGNGHVFFDSYELGPDQPHNLQLQVIQGIDCSQADEVWIQFYSQYIFFSSGAQAYLRIGTDGIQFPHQIPLFQNAIPQDFGQTARRTVLNITDFAAGDTIFLAFQWEGQWEDIWRLDDIGLFSQDPRAPFALKIHPVFYALSPDAVIPASQLYPLRFLFDFQNQGSRQVPAPKARVRIDRVFPSPESLFRDSLSTLPDTLPLDTIIQNNPFPNSFLPPKWPGLYRITYEVGRQVADTFFPLDSVNQLFRISDSTFAKHLGGEPIISLGAEGLPEGYTVANPYFIHHSMKVLSSSAQFALFNTEGLADEELQVSLHLWVDKNQDCIIEADEIGLEADTAGKTISVINHPIQGTGNQQMPEIANVDLLPELMDSFITLQDSSFYVLCLSFPPEISNKEPLVQPRLSNKDFLATDFLYSDRSPYRCHGSFFDFGGQLSNLSLIEQNFGLSVALQWNLVQDPLTHVKRPSFSEESNIRIFPNPVPQGHELRIALPQLRTDLSVATLSIYNFQGRCVLQFEKPAFQMSSTLTVDTESLPTGYYLIELKTDRSRYRHPFVVIDQ